MMRPTVLLYDIDGTLLDTGGAGHRAMDRAFARRHGRADACAGISFGGMTDRAILRAGLQAIAEAVTEEAMAGLLAAYLEALAEELATSQAAKVHEGIAEALDASERAGCAVGLGTGNIHDGARLKLGRVGLADRFAFGGFGSDHEIRSELLRIGAERGAALLGAPVAECRVVVIGDTPKDIVAAHAIGAECVAVATGPFAVERLEGLGARWVFRSLREEGAVRAVVEGR
jgi:phosphoglycolate phosphatase-like HAD superfamily hydrolase